MCLSGSLWSLLSWLGVLQEAAGHLQGPSGLTALSFAVVVHTIHRQIIMLWLLCYDFLLPCRAFPFVADILLPQERQASRDSAQGAMARSKAGGLEG